MAEKSTPHFHNDPGVKEIHIGSHTFKCTGATPPYDHPHIFLDMGHDDEIVCPYCSTHYIFKAELDANQAEPAECSYDQDKAA